MHHLCTRQLLSYYTIYLDVCIAVQDWKKRMELKTCFYQCITHYYMGRQSEDQQKMGERLAYFQASQDKLNESLKLAKVGE